MIQEKDYVSIDVLTVRELGQTLHIGRDKAYSLIKSSGFPSICIGNRYIVTRSALDDWLKRNEYKRYIV